MRLTFYKDEWYAVFLRIPRDDGEQEGEVTLDVPDELANRLISTEHEFHKAREEMYKFLDAAGVLGKIR